MFVAKNNGLIILAKETREELEQALQFMVYDTIEETDIDYKLVDGVYVDEQEQAKIKRKELVQLIYEIKAKKAYGGVIINDSLVFETNQVSITSTVASLALMSDTSTANWKFYTVDGQPYSQEITKAQLFGIASFGQAMINDCFAVEGQYNEKLKEATIKEINDIEWCEKFVEQVQSAMDEINNKMAVQFQPTLDNPSEVG